MDYTYIDGEFDIAIPNRDVYLSLYKSVKADVRAFDIFIYKNELIIGLVDNKSGTIHMVIPNEYKDKVNNSNLTNRFVGEEISFNTEEVKELKRLEPEILIEDDLDWDIDILESDTDAALPTDENIYPTQESDDSEICRISAPILVLDVLGSMSKAKVKYDDEKKNLEIVDKESMMVIRFKTGTPRRSLDFYTGLLSGFKLEPFDLIKVKSFIDSSKAITEKEMTTRLSLSNGRMYISTDELMVDSAVPDTVGQYSLPGDIIELLKNTSSKGLTLNDIKIGTKTTVNKDKEQFVSVIKNHLLSISAKAVNPQPNLRELLLEKDRVPLVKINRKVIRDIRFIGKYLDKAEDLNITLKDGGLIFNQNSITIIDEVKKIGENNISFMVDYYNLLRVIKVIGVDDPVLILFPIGNGNYVLEVDGGISCIIKVKGVKFIG